LSLGLHYLLLENAFTHSLPNNCDQLPPLKEPMLSGPVLTADKTTTQLHRLLTAICLHNPFWNDFRLLDFLAKRKIHLTLDELYSLKADCGLSSRAAVCQALLQLYSNNELQLNDQQIRFIERLNPAFCDRDIRTTGPGELLIYECLSSRKLPYKYKGQFYLHLFIDMFNGYAFGQFHSHRSAEIGINLLNQYIIPFYQEHGTLVATVLYSNHDTAPHVQEAAGVKSITPQASWQQTNRAFGTIASFRKFMLTNFFEGMRLYSTPMNMLQPTFTRWLKQYNASHSFVKYRDFLEYIDSGRCFQLMLD